MTSWRAVHARASRFAHGASVDGSHKIKTHQEGNAWVSL